MTSSKPDASPESPVELLIEKLEKSSPKGTFSAPENDCYAAGYRDAFEIIREHRAEQPEDLVLDALRKCRAHLITCGPFAGDSTAKLKELGGVGKVATLDSVNAAIAAIGDGSATIAPVSSETVQPITPAHLLNAALDVLKELRDTTPIASQRKRIDEFLAIGEPRGRLSAEVQTNAGENPASPTNSREIPVVEDLLDLLLVHFRGKKLGMEFGFRQILVFLGPYLRTTEPVDIEVGAIACSQWVYGSDHGKPSWDRLSEEHRNEYREQAKACARAWGIEWK